MGLLNWVMKGLRGRGPRLATSQQSQPPTFERLEPRLLLSADPVGLSAMDSWLDSPLDNSQPIAAIEMEMVPGLGTGSQVTDHGSPCPP